VRADDPDQVVAAVDRAAVVLARAATRFTSSASTSGSSSRSTVLSRASAAHASVRPAIPEVRRAGIDRDPHHRFGARAGRRRPAERFFSSPWLFPSTPSTNSTSRLSAPSQMPSRSASVQCRGGGLNQHALGGDVTQAMQASRLKVAGPFDKRTHSSLAFEAPQQLHSTPLRPYFCPQLFRGGACCRR